MKSENRIEELIEILNIKKIDFAKSIESSTGNVSDWITGRSNPSKKTLDKICSTFNISKDWLLLGIGNPFSTTKSTNSLISEQTDYSLSLDEETLIDSYRELDRSKKKQVQRYIFELISLEKESTQDIPPKSKLYNSTTTGTKKSNVV